MSIMNSLSNSKVPALDVSSTSDLKNCKIESRIGEISVARGSPSDFGPRN
jgi:hypothetical protein